MSSAPTQAPQDANSIQAALRSRLIESGEYEKLLGVLKTRLDEAGWEDGVRGVAREKARVQEPPNLQGLVNEIEPSALDSVPASVRSEIEGMLQKFVEKNVE
ncbi:transcription factor e(y)2-domain-containing protein [Leucosporidium creatinivorum]|uniref:Transcription and mRNA export factor SUS1 n=1 Tax=Leucosporidium creatinivorum TaxID=106004 RepID=A0A1Y2FMU8_9BASI|nr:transcription factor e(y)2-domain-containing protein [Leucosporidium creatinivorum]